MFTNPSYSLPPNLMCGIQCQESSGGSLEGDAGKKCRQRILLNYVLVSRVVATVQRVVGSALIYTRDGSLKNEATESEVEEWVCRWKKGEEERLLITIPVTRVSDF